MDIDRGITRIFTLVQERNYTINYDSTGSISKIKILTVRGGSGSETPGGFSRKKDTPGASESRIKRQRPFKPERIKDDDKDL
ncbi:MAG: hypothetical protein HZB31_02100 [Nitrospirae bacterium]|nr:hypothetical protein [Nitrospirota bacterium]